MTGFIRLLAVLVFAITASAFAANAEAGPVQLAQSDQQQDYLPPWQDEDSEAPGEDGDIGSRDDEAPRRLTPPRDTARERDGYSDDTSREARRYDDEPPARSESGSRYPGEYDEDENFTVDEIVDAGHRFFGTVTEGLAGVVEYAFQNQGYPNGYILGEEAGGAFVAGLRYGEGVLHTKHLGRHKVFWQGPSIGYDFGGEGSKTMILVYDIQHPEELYHRYAGVDGSAYLVGGVGITFQRRGQVVLAPIRSGVGLRLGANVGYLKYTREPTWNPF